MSIQDLRDKVETTYHWSRAPGCFVDVLTGEETESKSEFGFTGTPREWYEKLVVIIAEASLHLASKHEKHPFGLVPRKLSDISVFVSYDVLAIIQQTPEYRQRYFLGPGGEDPDKYIQGEIRNLKVYVSEDVERGEVLLSSFDPEIEKAIRVSVQNMDLLDLSA